ncbi:MAG: molybdopterin molybdenumtransferase MoeA [Cryomorphaceae bacterium]|nr:MAG: molybdopterin molybdenumtransferase MoeA [Cryomorphaceae bacterium]
MISPQEALEYIRKATPATAAEHKSPGEAHLQTLAEDVAAPHHHPFFDQSAMDGYAARFEDLVSGQALRIAAHLPAGSTTLPTIQPGEAARIFTGSAIPPGADTVIMQEHCSTENDLLVVERLPEKPGTHIRRCGEQIARGEVALPKGKVLNSSAIGFLASIGVQRVSVWKRPTAAIITTGSEFIRPGEELMPGKIFESNGIMLQTALQEQGIASERHICEDDPEKLTALINQLAEKTDLLLLTGGVSVGDHDHTPSALSSAGFNILFHKVNQKPGKPLLFATRKDCMAFGLPGNPRSVLMCYHVYVKAMLGQWTGQQEISWFSGRLRLTDELINRSGKTVFVTGKRTDQGVEPLRGQNSHMLQSFARADTIIVHPPEAPQLSAGSTVTVIPL